MSINVKLLKELAEQLNVPVVDISVDTKVEPEDLTGFPTPTESIYERTFKIKHNGQKLKVRVVQDDVVITNRMIHTWPVPSKKFLLSADIDVAIELIQRLAYNPTKYHNDPNETTGGVHNERLYLEVLSKFYN